MRVRYSLGTLLILVAVVSVIVGSLVVGTRLKQAERELQLLRAETGRLTIGDRSQVHVINVRVDEGTVDEPNTWRWRLFVPKGHKYSWNLAAENIPQHEVPQEAGVKGTSYEPYWERDNEVLVTATLRRQGDAHWRLSVESRIGDSKNQMAGGALKIPDEKLAWNTPGASTDGRVAGNRGTQLHDPSRPIILLQRRPVARQPDGSYAPSPDPMPGFMIWLQPE